MKTVPFWLNVLSSSLLHVEREAYVTKNWEDASAHQYRTFHPHSSQLITSKYLSPEGHHGIAASSQSYTPLQEDTDDLDGTDPGDWITADDVEAFWTRPEPDVPRPTPPHQIFSRASLFHDVGLRQPYPGFLNFPI